MLLTVRFVIGPGTNFCVMSSRDGGLLGDALGGCRGNAVSLVTLLKELDLATTGVRVESRTEMTGYEIDKDSVLLYPIGFVHDGMPVVLMSTSELRRVIGWLQAVSQSRHESETTVTIDERSVPKEESDCRCLELFGDDVRWFEQHVSTSASSLHKFLRNKWQEEHPDLNDIRSILAFLYPAKWSFM